VGFIGKRFSGLGVIVRSMADILLHFCLLFLIDILLDK